MSLRQIWETDERRRKKRKKNKNKNKTKKKKKKKKQKRKKGKEIKQTLSEMVTVPGTANPLSDSKKQKKNKKTGCDNLDRR